MVPASQIIDRCGGNKAVADWLGLDRSAVQRWTYPKPSGTGEHVPVRHWAVLIEKARENGVTIQLEELMPDEVVTAVSASKRRRRKREAA